MPSDSIHPFASGGRFHRASRSVWRQSHETCQARPPDWQARVAPATDALMTVLRELTGEAQLATRYWELGDPLGRILAAHLPAGTPDEELLELEEACLWRRLRELGFDPTDDE